MKKVLFVSLVVGVFFSFVLVGCGGQQEEKDMVKEDAVSADKVIKDFVETVKVPQEKFSFEEVDIALFQRLKQAGGKSDAEAFELMGLSYFKQQTNDKAILFLKRAVELDPSLFGSWYTLGLLHINTKQGNDYFLKSIEVNPDYALPYYYLAFTYFNHKAYKEAAILFTKYLEVAKDDPSEVDRYKAVQEILNKMRGSN